MRTIVPPARCATTGHARLQPLTVEAEVGGAETIAAASAAVTIAPAPDAVLPMSIAPVCALPGTRIKYTCVLKDAMEGRAAPARPPSAAGIRGPRVPARSHHPRDARVRGARRLRGDDRAGRRRHGPRIAERLLRVLPRQGRL